MSDLDELIEEARKCAPGDCSTELAVIVHRLADALEAATSVPVQGGLNDDREALHWCLGAIPGHVWDELHEIGDVTGIIDAILAAGFSRATVPDAATLQKAEAKIADLVYENASLKAERDAALDRIAELEVERDRALEGVADQRRGIARRMEDLAVLEVENLDLEAGIAEAAKLHRPRKHWNSDREYVFVCDECTRINRYGIAQWPCPTAVSLGLNEGENDD